MMKPTIQTTLIEDGTGKEIDTAYLLVVPDVGEVLIIGEARYRVRNREFKLTQQYNGGKPFGFSQSCRLVLDPLFFIPLDEVLNC